MQIFHDPSGQRWKKTQRWLVASFVIGSVLFAFAINFVTYPVHSPRPSDDARIDKEDVKTGLQVVGQGPLERVVKITLVGRKVTLTDPHTHEQLGAIDPKEWAAIRHNEYAIWRFGFAPGVSKKLLLTYDCGSSEAVTPQLLTVLSQRRVPATFFVSGVEAQRQPALIQRMSQEGHQLGIYADAFTHVGSNPVWSAAQEVAMHHRSLRDVVNVEPRLWRAPVVPAPMRKNSRDALPILDSHQLGYTHVSYSFEPKTLLPNGQPISPSKIRLPNFKPGGNITVRMRHDDSLQAAATVAYTERLLDAARAAGYTVQALPQAPAPLVRQSTDDLQEPRGAAATAGLFLLEFARPGGQPLWSSLGVLVMVLPTGLYALIGVGRRRRTARLLPMVAPVGRLRVSVVLAAHNEELVIEKTIQSILESDYPLKEIIVVDDGSTDHTGFILDAMAEIYPLLKPIHQKNGGKSAALNRAIEDASGSILITLDADTVLETNTISNLVRHFSAAGSEDLGAVAGVVTVGNRNVNLLTRWQTLEYVSQIGLERAAQDQLGAITIVPGACAAWRKEAIQAAGGYSYDTLAEDCDLTLTLQGMGWRLTQDDRARAYTEVPEDLDSFLKQRKRWIYGTIQAAWKHRRLLFARNHRALGWFVLPLQAIAIIVPVISMPGFLWNGMASLQAQGPLPLVIFFLTFSALNILFTAVAIVNLKEDWKLLLLAPLYRLLYEPLRVMLVYTAFLTALTGRPVSWNKPHRSGRLDMLTIDSEEELGLPSESPVCIAPRRAYPAVTRSVA